MDELHTSQILHISSTKKYTYKSGVKIVRLRDKNLSKINGDEINSKLRSLDHN